MRAAWLVGTLLIATALAGCAGDDDGGDGPTTTRTGTTATGTPTTAPTQTGTSTSTSTSTSGPGDENGAPTATLAASISGGAAPLNVTFDLSGADPDGDALTWTFDADGDGTKDAEGTELPAEVTFLYETAGNFTASLLVSDGTEASVASVDIEVTGEGGGAGSQVASVSWVFAAAGCLGPYDTWPVGTPAAGITHGEFEVDPATWGLTYTAVFSFSAPIYVAAIDFYDDGGTRIDGYFDTVDTLTGKVPDGAVYAVFSDCLGGPNPSAEYVAE